jgi:hypothetical protein
MGSRGGPIRLVSGTYVQAERAAAVAYIFRPAAASLRAYQATVASTQAREPAFKAAMTSGATVTSETSVRDRVARPTRPCHGRRWGSSPRHD